MKELIIGQIPDNFNPDIHIPISPSCFVGKEHIFPDFDKLEYIETTHNKEELKKYDQLTVNEALYWVNIVAKRYNPVEFDKYSFRFWKTIYFPWLGLLIPWIYRKQLLIDKVIEKYRNEKIVVGLVEKNLTFEINNEIDFIIDGVWNQTVNDWIFSRLIESKLPANWRASYKKGLFESDEKTILCFNKPETVKSLLLNKIHKSFYRIIGVYGFNLFNEVVFHLLLSLKPPVKNKQKKLQILKSKEINWYIDLSQMIDFLIPKSLKVLNKNKRNYRVGKFINYSNKLYYDIDAKLDAAFAHEKQEVVISSQHGGHNYGSAYTFEYGKEIEFKTDYFFSWGWKSEKFNIVDLPSPLLSKKLNKYKKSNENIILVGTDMRGFPSRFDSGLNEIESLDYRKNKVKFIEKLELRRNFLYRPYPEKKTSFSDSVFLLKKYPELNIHKGNLHNDLQKCKLLVLDHPGTTWNIAMAMNTPTLCFWNKDHFPFNREANLFFDRFQELGLYFEKPEGAAIKANSIIKEYKDLTIWWNKKEIQSLRKEWMNVYARADKNWFWIWAKTLWKLK